MQSDILFDNIYIGHSVEDASALAAETFDKKHVAEKAIEEAEKPKEAEKPRSPNDLKFLDDPVHYAKEKLDLFLTIAKQDPIQAAKFVPEVPAAIGTLLVSVIAIFGLIAMGGSAPEPVKKAAKDAKVKAVEAKDKAAEAVATGTEKAKEATKRATRSQS